jgi:hypothetical protein
LLCATKGHTKLWVQLDLGSVTLKLNPSDSSVEVSGLIRMDPGNLPGTSYPYQLARRQFKTETKCQFIKGEKCKLVAL